MVSIRSMSLVGGSNIGWMTGLYPAKGNRLVPCLLGYLAGK